MDAVAQQPDRLGRRALMAVLRGLVIFAVTLAAADVRAVDFSHDVVPFKGGRSFLSAWHGMPSVGFRITRISLWKWCR